MAEMKWLRCEVSKGMFSDERVVAVRTRNEGQREFFVPQDEVREDTPAVRVKAYVYDGGLWALIPTCQPEPVPIHDSDLLPA